MAASIISSQGAALIAAEMFADARRRLSVYDIPPPIVRAAGVLVFVLLAIGLVGHIEARWVRPHMFAYQVPVFDSYHSIRTVTMLLAGLAISVAAGSYSSPLAQLRNSRIWLLYLNLCAALAAATLVYSNIALFNKIALEDGPVENATAVLLFVASAIFGFTGWRLMRRAAKSKLAAALCLCLAAGFFVLGMEEISWMQRIIGYKTPDSLAHLNWQHEVNLHNTHTFVVNCLYYSLSGFALVFLPTLKPALREWPPFRPLLDFIPAPEVALLTAPAFIFNFAHWDVLPVQLTFWVAAGSVSLITLQQRHGAASALCLLVLLGLLGGQAFVLWGGMGSSIMPDSTEYQELLLSLGYTCFAVGVSRRFLA